MIISFPAELEQAIVEATKPIPNSQLMRAAAILSGHYRESLAAGGTPTVQGELAALSYTVIIMPATYAQLMGAMLAIRERLPEWKPLSLLDIGSGPGTALWAAAEQWSGLTKMVAWEREPAFMTLGQRLAKNSPNLVVKQAQWQQVTLRANTLPRDNASYDLVVIGHVLNELDEALRKAVITYAWEHCSGVLLLVEPGTSAGFPIVKAAREQLLSLGAQTIAPCTHDQPCPLTNDWCHFPQRINRPAFQRRAKAGSAGWEDSKLSYAAMAKFPVNAPVWGRLIHQPNVTKGFAELTVSAPEGIVKLKALKRNRESFQQFKDYNWGEAIPTKIEGDETNSRH